MKHAVILILKFLKDLIRYKGFDEFPNARQIAYRQKFDKALNDLEQRDLFKPPAKEEEA